MVIGKLITEVIRKEFSDTLSCCDKILEHRLGKRVFKVCKPSIKFENMVLSQVYEALSARSRVEFFSGDVKLVKNTLHVRLKNRRDFWYRLGLALSDGSSLDRKRIIFSISTPCTIDAVIFAFGNAMIYLGKIMMSGTTGKIIPALNIVVADKAVANTLHLLRRDNEIDLVIHELVDKLQSHKDYLALFLAGAIDGDGAISEYDVRLSVSCNDPLYSIINTVFNECVKYDSKRYLLRINTNVLRLKEILKDIADNVICEHKKRKLMKLYSKSSSRFRLRGFSISRESAERIATLLLRDPMIASLLMDAHFRKHGDYEYFVISVNRATIDMKKEAMLHVLRMLSDELSLNLVPALKIGTRELIIYNQDLVAVLKILREEIIRVGRRASPPAG